MSGNINPGRLSKLEVSTDGGATYLPVGGIVDVTPNFNLDELEVTSHDDAGHRRFIPNHDDMTLDGSMRFIDGDPGQDAVINALGNKTMLAFRYYPSIHAGKKMITGSLFPTSVALGAPLDDAQGLDFTLRCSGALIVAQ